LVVGQRDTAFLELLDWVASCVAVDLERVLVVPGARIDRGDLTRSDRSERYDLVFCLDVLEQVPKPVGFLQNLLWMGDVVVVSVPYRWPFDPDSDRRHDPIDDVKLQRWARRRWIASEVVEDEGRAQLVAAFRGGERGVAADSCDFGQSDDERFWLYGLAAAIDAVPLPRRRPPFAETVTARLREDDSLREEVTGSFGVYAVRALWNALGFDEHRKFHWRLEHKLVQAMVFNHYLGREFPASWGVDALVRRGQRERLLDGLFSGRLFAKEALGHLSGDVGESEATHDVLRRLLRRGELPLAGEPSDETWLVQERIAIEREYRVHSFEDLVLPGMTFYRYGPCPVPEGRDEVNAYVASILARLPDAMVGESLYAWDVARSVDGRFRVIETNLVGFHPVYERGFQASGFFQYHPHGPPLLVELARHVEATYNVNLELSGDWRDEPNRHALYLRVFRHYQSRPRVPTVSEVVPVPAEPPADRIDGVLSVRAEEIERFALLRESIACTGAPFGTLRVTVPDADLATVLASGVGGGPRCDVVPESELVPEIAEIPDVPPGVRRQVARLALVARTEGNFCFDLSADVVSVRRFRTADLIRGGKAYYSRNIISEFADRYEQAEDLLGLRRSGWFHGSIPYLFSKRAAAELTDYLETRAGAATDARGSWRRFLLGRRGWALGQVYFTFLEAFGLEERDYFPAEWNLYDNCIWSADDWEDWDPAASFDDYGSFYFTVVQVGRDVPAEAVRRRLMPYLGLAGTGGPRQSES
jgi:hypothetical protein